MYICIYMLLKPVWCIVLWYLASFLNYNKVPWWAKPTAFGLFLSTECMLTYVHTYMHTYVYTYVYEGLQMQV